METTIKIIATKKLSVEQLRLFNANFQVVDTDFIQIRNTRLPKSIVKDPIKHVVFTSKNAVDSLLQNFEPQELHFENIYCVGRKTKAFIEKHLGKVTLYASNALQLANILAEKNIQEEITFFCGNLRRDELPDLLTKKGFTVNEIPVYKTIFRSQTIEGDFQGVMFFSPSGVKSFVELNTFEDKVAFCIGNTTAKEAKKHCKQVKIAKIPTIENVIETVNQYYV